MQFVLKTMYKWKVGEGDGERLRNTVCATATLRCSLLARVGAPHKAGTHHITPGNHQRVYSLHLGADPRITEDPKRVLDSYEA